MSDHYYTDRPGSLSEVREIRYSSPIGELTFRTDHGVFSGSRVDYGSDLLIETVYNEETGAKALLDIGCGYGPIGITLGKAWPACKVAMVDVNHRAMELARENAAISGVDALVAGSSEIPDLPYEVVVTNPPIRAGKETVYGIFAKAFERMVPGGRLYVVIQKKQGAASAVKELERIFGNCETVERGAGFHILRSCKGNVDL